MFNCLNMRHKSTYSRGVWLILASSLLSYVQSVEWLGLAEDANVFYYNVRGPLELQCNGIQEDGATIIWTKNGEPVGKVPELSDRVELHKSRTILKIKGRSIEGDYGKYTCLAGSASRSWEVRGLPRVKIPANSYVSEGEYVKLTCTLIGKPYTAVRWLYSNTSEVTKDTPDAQTVLGKRVVLAKNAQGVVGAQLTLGPAQLTDEGWFTCMPVGEGVPGSTRLRVKSRNAALWPFLGICAEVLLLCGIILWYERRYKKNHRLENDDTEQDNNKL